MDEQRPIRELLGEFGSVLVEYVRQTIGDYVDEMLGAPLRRAAKKAMLVGLACGLAAMAAICLALGLFHTLVDLLGVKSSAYVVTCLLCVILAALCTWGLARDEKKGVPKPSAGHRRGAAPKVGPDSGETK